jgi:hypothetical protein
VNIDLDNLSFMEEKELLHYVNANYEPDDVYSEGELLGWIRKNYRVWDIYDDNEIIEAHSVIS